MKSPNSTVLARAPAAGTTSSFFLRIRDKCAVGMRHISKTTILDVFWLAGGGANDMG